MSLFSRIFISNLLAIALVLCAALVAMWFGGGAAALRWSAMAAENLRFHEQVVEAALGARPGFDLQAYFDVMPASGTIRAYHIPRWPPQPADFEAVAPADRVRIERAVSAGGDLPPESEDLAVVDVPAPAGGGKLVLLGQPLPLGEVIRWPVALIIRVGITFAIILVITWLTVRHIANPIRRLHREVLRYDPNDPVPMLAAPLRNRTDDVGQLARGFEEMARRVQVLMEFRERLLRDVAHELRSPLARQRIALELLRARPSDPAVLAQLEREAERMERLIRDLTEISRAESGGRPGDLVPIALDHVLEEVLRDVRFEAQARPCRIVVRQAHRGVVRGSNELLRRAIENVVRNAVRHTGAGTDVDIELTRGDDGAYELRVRDQGPGVAPEHLPHLFEPFFRTDPARDHKSGGSGLGLAIAERAVRVHGGTAAASNAAGGGLIVTLRIPGR